MTLVYGIMFCTDSGIVLPLIGREWNTADGTIAMKYPWKRFWCPRDGAINLSDEGFLFDPESEHAKYIAPDVVAFESISHLPCLALLGEPGIGKSTALEDLRDEIEQAIKASGDHLLYINLNVNGGVKM